jgi:hypothetical protein
MEDFGCRVSDHWLSRQFILANPLSTAKTPAFLSESSSFGANVKP